MKPLDGFVGEVAAPLLRERGYKRSGRSFWLDAGSRHGVAFLGFQEFRLGRHDLEFFVNMSVTFPAWRQWVYGDDDMAEPNEADGLWHNARLAVPGKSWMQELHLWELDVADSAAVELFHSTLAVALDRLEYLTVRSNMIEALRRHELPIEEIGLPTERHAIARLLSEEGPSPELEEALTEIEAEQGRDEFVTWVRQQVNRLRGD